MFCNNRADMLTRRLKESWTAEATAVTAPPRRECGFVPVGGFGEGRRCPSGSRAVAPPRRRMLCGHWHHGCTVRRPFPPILPRPSWTSVLDTPAGLAVSGDRVT